MKGRPRESRTKRKLTTTTNNYNKTKTHMTTTTEVSTKTNQYKTRAKTRSERVTTVPIITPNAPKNSKTENNTKTNQQFYKKNGQLQVTRGK